MKKIFGEINISWKKLIIFSLLAGFYTAIMAIIPITKDTSFRDISISFEVWILFGIIIITNSKSPKDSALKCFIFFLISQPLIYLIQVPFSRLGWQLFNYYPTWFMWTLLTIPMGYIGYYIKKDKWWGLLILTPVIIFLCFHYYGFLTETISFFPNHLLSTIFCIVSIIIYPLFIFNNKKIKKIGLIISIILILISTILCIKKGSNTYNTTVLASNQEHFFNNTYKVSLKDNKYGKVYIVYEKNIEDYMINAEFKKIGKTELIIESPEGEKQIFTIDIKRTTYNIKRKK